MSKLTEHPSIADALAGMQWWNGLTECERAYWMDVAGNTGVAADAWAAYVRWCGEPLLE